MKLLCIKDVICTDSATSEKEKSFSKGKTYKSRLFRSGMELYAIDDYESMHIVANGSDREETLEDLWFHKHFEIIDENNNDW